MEKDYYQYYVYRHVRLDTNQVFYIGRGRAYCRPARNKKFDATGYAERYFRAYDSRGRSIGWKGVAKSTGYEVEILFESDDLEFINKKEQEFIELYGRICNGTGSLVNITRGGDGQTQMSTVSREKLKATHIQNGNYEKMAIDRRLPICIYDLCGKFIKRFELKKECAFYLNCSENSLQQYLTKKKSINDCFISRTYKPEGIDVSGYKAIAPKSRKIEKYDLDFNLLAVYENQIEAIKKEKGITPAVSIWRGCNQEKPIKGIYWRYAKLGHRLKGGSYEIH